MKFFPVLHVLSFSEMVMNLGQIFVLASVISPLFGNEISFHNTSALDGIERLYLRSLEKAYPFLVPVDVNFIPDDSKTIHEKTAGVSVNIYPNRITISAQVFVQFYLLS